MHLSFQYGDTTIDFELSYSRRKTIAISVEAPGRVSVKAPLGLSEDEIINRVKSKARWIVQKLYEVKNVKTIAVKKEFVNGESFMYLGRNYSLQLIMDTKMRKPRVKLYQGKFMVATPSREEEPIKKAMLNWYRKKAREQINERIKYYQPKVGVQPARITVKEQKKRWGSCSSRGNLNFNWRAVMAPSPVLDYIIVHELCHLKHHNHSREFWNLLASILPDYKNRREWLKKNGVRLNL
ncbi:MAG: M48 family metallopeptidase [Syntrophomonadaceae bacterium]|jgi:predicted metal-dependent hydrolase|nr:M48 family metallopeptidase [Syntrophomonadaceae bacterium]